MDAVRSGHFRSHTQYLHPVCPSDAWGVKGAVLHLPGPSVLHFAHKKHTARNNTLRSLKLLTAGPESKVFLPPVCTRGLMPLLPTCEQQNTRGHAVRRVGKGVLAQDSCINVQSQEKDRVLTLPVSCPPHLTGPFHPHGLTPSAP